MQKAKQGLKLVFPSRYWTYFYSVLDQLALVQPGWKVKRQHWENAKLDFGSQLWSEVPPNTKWLCHLPLGVRKCRCLDVPDRTRFTRNSFSLTPYPSGSRGRASRADFWLLFSGCYYSPQTRKWYFLLVRFPYLHSLSQLFGSPWRTPLQLKTKDGVASCFILTLLTFSLLKL